MHDDVIVAATTFVAICHIKRSGTFNSDLLSCSVTSPLELAVAPVIERTWLKVSSRNLNRVVAICC
jgi:hypothetical protein